MTEESEGKFDSENAVAMHNQDAKKEENGWIVCRSQKRPGRLYDFNINTGEAVWRDPDTITHNLAIMDTNNVQFDHHKPTDPPVDPKPYHQNNATPSSSVPKIYNKQIINNQFAAKPFTIDHFGNPCAPYGLLNHNNAIGLNTPQVWVAAPAPPVIIGPSVNTLPQLPTIYGGLENIHLQNPSVTLSNRFQLLKQMKNEMPTCSNNVTGGVGGTSGNQSFNNYNHNPHRKKWKFGTKHINRQKDLRSLLTSRKRQDFQSDTEDNPETKEDVSARLTEEDLNPDDTDKWLEVHTDGEGKKLNIDVGCIWDLADSGDSRDCWFIIPTTRALLNNMRFLTSLVLSDERLRLLAPRDVVRALRSAAFSGDCRLADCASRSRTFIIRQMSKVPNALKEAGNVISCRKSIGSNTLVIHLIDEKETPNKEFAKSLQFTAIQLKQFFESKIYSQSKPVSKMQQIVENIKIVVTNDEAKEEPESLNKLNSTGATSTQSADPERAGIDQNVKYADRTGFNETVIQTDLPSLPPPIPKLTANACCQTDFTLTHSEIKSKEINISQIADTGAAANDSKASKTPNRKIKLRRQQPTNTGSQSDGKKMFRWRKRQVAAMASSETTPQLENSNKTCSQRSSPPSSTSASYLLAQQNDNVIDYGHSDFSVHAKIVDESSTSAVISNSIDSETMFKINKEAILSESKTDHKEEGIVFYEITSDCMEDRLSMRCDEWVSRFVQIMEEVLSQVLLLDPPFIDSTLPPPWNFQEATVCVKRKFKGHNTIAGACDILDGFLMKINYERGNIETRISPTDFMLMYSYGVNLVTKLQVILENCEDLQVASVNLQMLLKEIGEPNLDESYEMDNLNCDDPMNFSPNISEMVTTASNTEVRYNPSPSFKKSPQKAIKPTSCDNSPARYSLRSSRSAEKRKAAEVTEAESKDNKDYTLFASLGLQKNQFVPDKYIEKTIFNFSKVQERITPPVNEVPGENQGSVQDVQENNVDRVEPKIIRNFSICPEMENKLKGAINNKKQCPNTKNDQSGGDDDYATEYCAVDDYAAADYALDDYVADDYIDYERDGDANAEPHNDDHYMDLSRTTAMDADQNYETQKSVSADLDASSILKLFIQITTFKYRRWLEELHKFCQVTNTALKSKDCSLTEYQIRVLEKTTKVSEHAKNVCDRLTSVLNRDPSDKFRALMKDYGIQDFDMNDAQLAEYRVTIGKYLELAEQLSICATRLADTVKAK